MQTNDLPRIGVLSADPAAVTQFLRRVQALGADPTALLPLSPAAVPDCEPYLCGTSTQSPLPKLRAARPKCANAAHSCALSSTTLSLPRASSSSMIERSTCSLHAFSGCTQPSSACTGASG